MSVDPLARGRVVQRTLFAPPRDEEPGKLYLRVERGMVEAERKRVVLAPHAAISTNTYFGRFPAAYWQRWTPAPRVVVLVEARGTGVVRLMASDSVGESRAVAAVRCRATEPRVVELVAPLDRFLDGGALWLEAATAAEPLVLDRVRWLVDGPGRGHRAALAICTYNRAQDCLAVLRAVASDVECLALLDKVVVVDQGDDPLCAAEGFDGVEQVLEDRLCYVRQPNLGGAGGFTRGLYEVHRRDRSTHVVLMDDDVVAEPESVVRMVGFAESAEEPTLVGGQMLRLLHPHRLHVAAERADLRRLRAGRPVPGALFDADVSERRQQDLRVDAEYNAWWSCLIPPEVPVAVGYPLPLFFQWDDIEYGLRARRRGFRTVTLPGAGVWHADFAWKDWDDWSRYFTLRNSLITAALHSEFDLRRAITSLLGQLCTYVVSMRYGLAATLISAVEDFLAGPDQLADGGAQAAATIRKLRAGYPETAVRSAKEVRALPIASASRHPLLPRPVLLHRLALAVLGRSRGKASIRAVDDVWWHSSQFDVVVATDPSQAGFKVRTRDWKVARDLGTRGALVLLRLAREGRDVRRLYRKALPELTGVRDWGRLFGADA
ncbi:glycosyltransferase [Actinosynnema sp. NPDC059335]|uniref:glycosyltransferase n=1 Tax=Actinosynnema sp. NPDC059335 TaxID=3346804 RepID=UPI0036718F7D